MSYCNRFTFIIFLLFVYSTFDLTATEFTPAKLTSNDNTRFSQTKLATRQEYWQWANYIIDEQGNTKDIIILNATSTQQKDFASQYIANLSFQPATTKKQPVPSNNFLLFNKNKSFIGNNNNNISKQFQQRYQDINQLIDAQRFKEVELALAELYQKETKNLTEQALHAWLASYYYFKTSDKLNYLKQIKIAYRLREHMPTNLAYKISMSFFNYKLHYQAFNEAINILANLKHIKGLKFDQSSYDNAYKKVITLASATPQIQSEKVITEFGHSYHHISRRALAIVPSDKIEKIELRCINNHHVFKQSELSAYKVAPQWQDCKLFFTGKPGASIHLTETGSLTLL